MPAGEAELFSWRFFDFGDWRLALTSPRRRPASVRPAGKIARSFQSLPPEPLYARGARGIDGAAPGEPPAGGLAVFDEACSLAGGVLVTASGEIVAESLAGAGQAGMFRSRAPRGRRRRQRANLAADADAAPRRRLHFFARGWRRRLPRLADRPAAAHRRRRAILRPVAVQDRRFAPLGRDGADHPRQSRPVRNSPRADCPDRRAAELFPAAGLSAAGRERGLRQIAARDRGAGVPARAFSLRSGGAEADLCQQREGR